MQTYEEAPTFDFIVGRSVKCRVLERINHGSYGLIHKGILVEDGKKVVVKLERQTVNIIYYIIIIIIINLIINNAMYLSL